MFIWGEALRFLAAADCEVFILWVGGTLHP